MINLEQYEAMQTELYILRQRHEAACEVLEMVSPILERERTRLIREIAEADAILQKPSVKKGIKDLLRGKRISEEA